jgi:hypothetical protein
MTVGCGLGNEMICVFARRVDGIVIHALMIEDICYAFVATPKQWE